MKPGVVPIDRWRPDSSDDNALRPLSAYGGVGRKH